MKKTILFTLAMLTILSSCSSYTATGAAMGGMVGSAIGGLAGGPRGSDIGTLVGMVTGAAMGSAAEERERAEYYRQRSNDDMYYYRSQSAERRARAAEQRAEKAERRARIAEEKARKAEEKARKAEMKSRKTSGFTLERGEEPGKGMTRSYYVPSDTAQYSSTGRYDDRIEMK